MQKRIAHRIRLAIAVIGMILSMAVIFAVPLQAEAAEQNVTMTSCKLNSSGKKLTVKAKVRKVQHRLHQPKQKKERLHLRSTIKVPCYIRNLLWHISLEVNIR